jgi:hypothetical protein
MGAGVRGRSPLLGEGIGSINNFDLLKNIFDLLEKHILIS